MRGLGGEDHVLSVPQLSDSITGATFKRKEGDKLVIILAGYEKEMSELLAVNPGLASRFPKRIHFPDYTPAELLEIMRRMVAARNFKLDESAVVKLRDEVLAQPLPSRSAVQVG